MQAFHRVSAAGGVAGGREGLKLSPEEWSHGGYRPIFAGRRRARSSASRALRRLVRPGRLSPAFRLLVAAGGAERQRAGARVGGTVHLLVRGASLCAAIRADRVQPRQQHGLLAKRRSSSRGPSRCRAFLVHRPFRERASRVPWSAELIYRSIFRRRGQFVARSSSSSRRRAEVLWCVSAWAWPRAARPSSQVGFSIRPAAPGLRRHLRMGSVAATPG